MTGTGSKNRLRKARIAGDSVLNERILPKERLDSELVGVVAGRMKSIVGEMEAEWESNLCLGRVERGIRPAAPLP